MSNVSTFKTNKYEQTLPVQQCKALSAAACYLSCTPSFPLSEQSHCLERDSPNVLHNATVALDYSLNFTETTFLKLIPTLIHKIPSFRIPFLQKKTDFKNNAAVSTKYLRKQKKIRKCVRQKNANPVLLVPAAYI